MEYLIAVLIIAVLGVLAHLFKKTVDNEGKEKGTASLFAALGSISILGIYVYLIAHGIMHLAGK